jgi:hypothetical protein
MGIKKPAVIAKATKKRGRPAGSKNKKKTLADYPVGATIPSEEFFEALENSVDWEKLAKQLQAALAAEMKENEALERIVAEFKSVVRVDSSFTFWDRLVFLFSGKL